MDGGHYELDLFWVECLEFLWNGNSDIRERGDLDR